jgi:hypothetical protein
MPRVENLEFLDLMGVISSLCTTQYIRTRRWATARRASSGSRWRTGRPRTRSALGVARMAAQCPRTRSGQACQPRPARRRKASGLTRAQPWNTNEDSAPCRIDRTERWPRELQRDGLAAGLNSFTTVPSGQHGQYNLTQDGARDGARDRGTRRAHTSSGGAFRDGVGRNRRENQQPTQRSATRRRAV